jgi:hypothetical protein
MIDDDSLCIVLLFISFHTVQRTCQLVSHQWYNAIHSGYYWRLKLQVEFPSHYEHLVEKHGGQYFPFNRKQFFKIYYGEMSWKYRVVDVTTCHSPTVSTTRLQPNYLQKFHLFASKQHVNVCQKKYKIIGCMADEKYTFSPLCATIESNRHVYVYLTSEEENIVKNMGKICKIRIKVKQLESNLLSVHFVGASKNQSEHYLLITSENFGLYLVYLNELTVDLFRLRTNALKLTRNGAAPIGTLSDVKLIQKSSRDFSSNIQAVLVNTSGLLHIDIDLNLLSYSVTDHTSLVNGTMLMRIAKNRSVNDKTKLYCVNQCKHLETFTIHSGKISDITTKKNALVAQSSCVDVIPISSYCIAQVLSVNKKEYHINIVDSNGVVLAQNLHFPSSISFSHYFYHDPYLVVLVDKRSSKRELGDYKCYVFEVDHSVFTKSKKQQKSDEDVLLALKEFYLSSIRGNCYIHNSIYCDQFKLAVLVHLKDKSAVHIYDLRSGKLNQEIGTSKRIVELVGFIGPTSLLVFRYSNTYKLQLLYYQT